MEQRTVPWPGDAAYCRVRLLNATGPAGRDVDLVVHVQPRVPGNERHAVIEIRGPRAPRPAGITSLELAVEHSADGVDWERHGDAHRFHLP